MEKKVRARAVITGKVQGVFFRMATRNEAQRWGLSGWARNRSDGTVEAVFEGDRSAVDTLLQWCKKGPPHARVDRVDIQWEDPGEDPADDLDHFEIRY